MFIPRAYTKALRLIFIFVFLSFSALLLLLSSYHNDYSVSPSTPSPSLFFIPSIESSDIENDNLVHGDRNKKEKRLDTEISGRNSKRKYNKFGKLTNPYKNSYSNKGTIPERKYRVQLELGPTDKTNEFEHHILSAQKTNLAENESKKIVVSDIKSTMKWELAQDIQSFQREISTKPISVGQPHPLLHLGRPSPSTVNSSMTKLTGDQYKYRYDTIIAVKRKAKSLWERDEKCRIFKVHFAKYDALPPCALASYPGSGNTWTRRLLEAASGIYTGSIYTDQQLFVNGYYGEMEPWNSGTTFAQKTHDCGPIHVGAFNGSAILLLRNPYRAILSFHNYLFAGHIGFAPISNYRRKDWGKFVHLQAKTWLELAINWTTLSNPQSLTVLHYEHLKLNPVPDLDRVLRTRGFLPDPQRMECLQKAHSYKTFKRRTEEYVPDKLEIFSANDRDKIDRAIRYVDFLLRKRGQQPLPLHLYEFYNGTAATHITRISCLKGETEGQCDNRVDNLNLVRKGRDQEGYNRSKERRRWRDR